MRDALTTQVGFRVRVTVGTARAKTRVRCVVFVERLIITAPVKSGKIGMSNQAIQAHDPDIYLKMKKKKKFQIFTETG